MSGEETAIVIGAAALSIAGVAFALLATTIARRVTDLVGLAGGVVILLVAIFHLAPEAFASGVIERFFLFGGAAVGIALEMLFRVRSGPALASSARMGAWLGLLLLAIHSTLDGAVYTTLFWHGDSTELLASFGLILHEAPEGVAAMALALQAGMKPWPAAGVAIFASSLTTPIGWGLAHLIGDAGNDAMQAMFAASAGLMLYVGWHLIAGGWKAIRAKRQA
ncbi:MAG TPA: ZIP family metal transporter [Hyphomonadaceae bacterium]|nr:ZIP family metal transporter [Hyphomonadaceae bacterium]